MGSSSTTVTDNGGSWTAVSVNVKTLNWVHSAFKRLKISSNSPVNIVLIFIRAWFCCRRRVLPLSKLLEYYKFHLTILLSRRRYPCCCSFMLRQAGNASSFMRGRLPTVIQQQSLFSIGSRSPCAWNEILTPTPVGLVIFSPLNALSWTQIRFGLRQSCSNQQNYHFLARFWCL